MALPFALITSFVPNHNSSPCGYNRPASACLVRLSITLRVLCHILTFYILTGLVQEASDWQDASVWQLSNLTVHQVQQSCATAGSLTIGDASLPQPAKPRFAAKHRTLGRVGSFLARQAGQAHSTWPACQAFDGPDIPLRYSN